MKYSVQNQNQNQKKIWIDNIYREEIKKRGFNNFFEKSLLCWNLMTP
jgi:hypothetical protein